MFNDLNKNAKTFWAWGVFLFVVLVFIDQFIKQRAKNIFHNSNFAFSLPLPVWLIYLIYAGVILWMVYYAVKNYRSFSFIANIAWALIFAGAIFNVGERIILGYVRDWIYITAFKWTGIYNAADFFIIAGIILLLLPISKLKKQNDL
jgi:signal peptidase II